MTPQEQAAQIVAAPSFPANAVSHIANATAKATQVETGIGIYRGDGDPGRARFWTHVACLLVAAADNPHIVRGTVLDGLVEKYGDGLPPGS